MRARFTNLSTAKANNRHCVQVLLVWSGLLLWKGQFVVMPGPHMSSGNLSCVVVNAHWD